MGMQLAVKGARTQSPPIYPEAKKTPFITCLHLRSQPRQLYLTHTFPPISSPLDGWDLPHSEPLCFSYCYACTHAFIQQTHSTMMVKLVLSPRRQERELQMQPIPTKVTTHRPVSTISAFYMLMGSIQLIPYSLHLWSSQEDWMRNASIIPQRHSQGRM